jgi:hypothetical protein
MDKTTAMTLSFVAVVFVIVAITEQQPAKAQTTTTTPTVNFTQLFKQKFTGTSVVDVTVVYQSPATVVLEGNAISMILESNQNLWKAVDLVKERGFTIDSVVTSGVSTEGNPLVYHIILSHK